MATIPLKGSERSVPPGAKVVAPADSNEHMEVSVLVRRRALPAMQSRVASLARGDQSGGFLSREQFAQTHGAAHRRTLPR